MLTERAIVAGLAVRPRRPILPRTAVYRQIMADIRAAIDRGDLQPGDQLPTQKGS
jgi:DNA-binding FadR family transcriptional regulator